MARSDAKMLAVCLCVVLASAAVADAQLTVPNLLTQNLNPPLADLLKPLVPTANTILCTAYSGKCQDLVPKLLCQKDISCLIANLTGLSLCNLLCSLLSCGSGKCLADGSCACNPKQ